MNVYLLLGSNLGNKFAALDQARDEIASEFGQIKDTSSVYEAEPWGFMSEELFLNQVLLIDTNESAELVLEKILMIEKKIGRNADQHGPKSRVIDIDILLYGQEVVKKPDLIIPHPRMHLRNFALIPMKEINPAETHPVFNKSITKLAEECPDKLRVKKLEKIV